MSNVETCGWRRHSGAQHIHSLLPPSRKVVHLANLVNQGLASVGSAVHASRPITLKWANESQAAAHACSWQRLLRSSTCRIALESGPAIEVDVTSSFEADRGCFWQIQLAKHCHWCILLFKPTSVACVVPEQQSKIDDELKR